MFNVLQTLFLGSDHEIASYVALSENGCNISESWFRKHQLGQSKLLNTGSGTELIAGEIRTI